MAKRQKVEASQKVDASGVDFLILCEDIVHKMEGAVQGGKLINLRQCKSLTTKLSGMVAWVRIAVESCDPRYRAAFAPLLLAFYRNYRKAEDVVKQCGEEDWCAAAVFKYRNWSPFEHIVGCLNDWMIMFDECVGEFLATLTWMPKLENCEGTLEDEDELRKRLEDLAIQRSNSSFRIFGFLLPDQAALKQQHLARFLLKRMPFRRTKDLNTIFSPILWEKENEPEGTWGDVKLLGGGSGATSVLKTSWLGVPCARKEFHGEVSEAKFFEEVEIMAGWSHPCIVDLICYGNGEGKGDQFIAMELMEKSLYDLIKEREGVHFSLEVALDIILQIAIGMNHMHTRGVAHRDLKPHNVVVKTLRSPYHEDYYCVKLVDFGSCKSEVEASKSNTITFPGIGTTRYRAPEVFPNAHLEKKGRVNWFKADVYSFAMTCAHILTLKEPYEELESLSTLYTEILKGRRPILPREYCPHGLVELMENCWSTYVTMRPGFETIFGNQLLANIRFEYAILTKLSKLMFDNMRQPINDVMTLVMRNSENNNVGTHDIKKEQYQTKEEGHTSFFTAQDGSLCDEVVSQERDSKHDIISQLEEAKIKVET